MDLTKFVKLGPLLELFFLTLGPIFQDRTLFEALVGDALMDSIIP